MQKNVEELIKKILQKNEKKRKESMQQITTEIFLNNNS